MEAGLTTSESDACSRERFVILIHDHPFLHWDLMLELDGVLKTWRLLTEPDSAREIIAEPLPDHRRHYLDYEGPVSGSRGSVIRWDTGDLEWINHATEPSRFILHGERLSGEFVVEREANGCWLRRFAVGE